MQTEKILNAIYHMLFYSVWQGALIALIAAVIILSTKKSAAALRYNLLLVDLMLFIVAVSLTFALQLFQNESIGTIQNYYGTNGFMNYQVPYSLHAAIEKMMFFLNSNVAVIVACWFFVILFKFVGFSAGLTKIARLKMEKSYNADSIWQEKVAELSCRLGIKKSVILLRSASVNIPLTAGFLKPVILLPAALMTSLSPGQLEAILLHELAHIRRNDYLVNLMQSIVEILFFFNPAVWWLCRLIRTERENCCDDLAVAQCSNKLNYIKTLVFFQEIQAKVPRFGAGISGSEDTVLNRAKRILLNRNKTLQSMEKIILTATLLVTGLLTIAFSRTSNNNNNLVRKNHSSDLIHPAGRSTFQHITYYTQDTVPVKKTESNDLKEEKRKDTIGIRTDMNPREQKEKENIDMLKGHDDVLQKENERTKNDLSKMLSDDVISLKDKMNQDILNQTSELRIQLDAMKDQLESAKVFSKELNSAQMKAMTDNLRNQKEQIQQQLEQARLFAEDAKLYSKDMQMAQEKFNELSLKMQSKELEKQLQMAHEALQQAKVSLDKSLKKAEREKRKRKEQTPQPE